MATWPDDCLAIGLDAFFIHLLPVPAPSSIVPFFSFTGHCRGAAFFTSG
jgi:hypothetical protein